MAMSPTVAKAVKGIVTAAMLCITVLAISENVYNHFKQERYNALLLKFMVGGLPAVEARCILETKRPEEIAPCVKASTPVRGREL